MATLRISNAEAQGNSFPKLCAVCAVPTSGTVTNTFTWCPNWVPYLYYLGGLPYFIVAAQLTKRTKINLPMCRAHRNHWRNRSCLLVGSLALLLAFVLGGFFVAGSGLSYFLGCLGFLALWTVVMIVCQTTAIAPKYISDNETVLVGVSPKFVEAVVLVDQEQVQYVRLETDYDGDEAITGFRQNSAVSKHAIQE